MKDLQYIIITIFFCLAILGPDTGLSFQEPAPPPDKSVMSGPLIAAFTAMETAWDIPKNPFSDSLLRNSPHVDQIQLGYLIFVGTPQHANKFNGNTMSCTNCHLNAGQREKAMPLVGVAAVYPEYNKREGRVFSLEDRIVGCFLRSQNATGIIRNRKPAAGNAANVLPDVNSKEVLALSAYITWLSEGYNDGKNLPWRGHNVIPQDKLIPPEKLDRKLGYSLYKEKCSNCHGEDGQGVAIGDKKAGPLWGKDSWNDGAGAARTYTLAGMIRYSMPYIDPGSLTDEEAQHIAAFINSQPRPVFPFKNDDYVKEPLPKDAVYYKRPSKK